MVQSGGKLVSNRLYQVTGDKKGLMVRVQLHTRVGSGSRQNTVRERDGLNESERERVSGGGREENGKRGLRPLSDALEVMVPERQREQFKDFPETLEVDYLEGREVWRVQP